MRYLLAVADLGSLTQAAEFLDVTQPALSQVLNRLEHELGVKLLTRSRRGATLTVAGQAIIDDVRDSLGRADAATLRAKAVGAGRAGRLTIGFVTNAVYEVLPRALRTLHAELPEVEVVLREMNNADQAQALAKGSIDVALLHTPAPLVGHMHEKVVGRDRMIAAVPVHFALGSDGKIGLADIARAGLIWFPEQHLPVLRAGILAAIRKTGEEARVVQEINRALTALACVSAGMGVSLLPVSVRALQHCGVRFAEVRDNADLPRFELSVAWPVRSREMLADRFAAMLAPV